MKVLEEQLLVGDSVGVKQPTNALAAAATGFRFFTADVSECEDGGDRPAVERWLEELLLRPPYRWLLIF